MLIGAMFLAGIACYLLERAAHLWMRNRTYTTPVPRYFVGVLLALMPWTTAAGVVLIGSWPSTYTAIVLVGGLWYVFGCAAAAAWLGYEKDRPRATERDAERLANYISGEHADG